MQLHIPSDLQINNTELVNDKVSIFSLLTSTKMLHTTMFKSVLFKHQYYVGTKRKVRASPHPHRNLHFPLITQKKIHINVHSGECHVWHTGLKIIAITTSLYISAVHHS